MNAYLITESPHGSEILKNILPKELIQKVTVVGGTGRYSAQSIASTILVSKQQPVALVINANTIDTVQVQQQRELSHGLLHQVSPGIPFEVFTAVPSIEGVFFHYKTVLEDLIGGAFTDNAWEEAKRSPKKGLRKGSNEPLDATVTILLGKLSDTARAIYRNHPLIRDIEQFLATVTTKHPTQLVT
jgi:hypothetical protein